MILTSLIGRRGQLATKIAGRPLSEVPGSWFSRGTESAAGVSVDPESALSLSGVFAAVNLLSAVTAALPLTVYRQSGRNRSAATTHPGYRVLHTQFNPEMTSVMARRTLEFHRLLFGNAYAEAGWDGGGNIRYIWPVEPWRVQPSRDQDGRLFYLVDGSRRVSPADLIHVPLISFDGVTGRSFVDFAIESLGLGLATQDFAARFFGNGAKPGGLLKHPSTPAKEARDKFREEWQRNHGGSANANKTAVLWGGWDYVPNDGAFNAQESQLLEQRRFSIEEVARWLNLPPHLLRELGRATWANIEHANIDFLQYSLGPSLVMWEQEYDRKLFNPPTLYTKHNVTALLRGDSASRSTFYREQFNIGAMSINNILELEERNPIEGGDTHFVPANMVPLERAIEEPEPPPAPSPFPTMPGTEPPVAQEQEEGDEEGDAEERQARRRLLESTLHRLLRVEAKEVERAATRPGKFLAWLDAYQDRHRALLAEALAPVLAVCRPGGSSLVEAECAATAWVRQSASDLLDVAGAATPAALPGAIETLLASWRDRPAQVAAALLEKSHAEVAP